MPFSLSGGARALAAASCRGSVDRRPGLRLGTLDRELPALARDSAPEPLDAHFYPLDACRRRRRARPPRRCSRAGSNQARRARRSPATLARRAAGADLGGQPISCGGVARRLGLACGCRLGGAAGDLRAARRLRAVRFHSSGGAYDPFVARAAVLLRPLYLGLRALRDAARRPSGRARSRGAGLGAVAISVPAEPARRRAATRPTPRGVR